MEIKKDTILYRGKEYPCVVIELTSEEADKHFESDTKVFADEELWDLISKSDRWEETDNSDGEEDVDGLVDFYMDERTCARFCGGLIPVSVMKIKVARIILSW